jgi:hypothetical protein
MTDFVDFGSVGWVLVGVYLLLVLVSQVAWWSWRTYFPNRQLAEGAHDRFHLSIKESRTFGKVVGGAEDPIRDEGEHSDGLKEPGRQVSYEDYEKAKSLAEERFWHNIAFRLISQVPSELSIAGFFCAMVWPVFVLLNVLLLAQVVGTQVGEGGGVIDIHPFGTYGAIPLVTAVLYAVAQSVFGIMFGEAEKKDKKRYLALLLLLLAILLEGGLAVYRAWLIRGGDATAGANLIDSTLAGRFGLVVGAFFGIFFPATHAALAYVGFPQFVRPAIRYALRVAGGLAALALAVANYFLLAWHPVHPKDFIPASHGTRLSRKKAEELKKLDEKLKADAEKKAKEDERAEKEREAEAERKADEEKIKQLQAGLAPDERHHWIQQVNLVPLAGTLSGDLEALYARLPATPADVKETIEAATNLRLCWSGIAENAKHIVAVATQLDADRLAVMASKLSAGQPASRPEDSSADDALAAGNAAQLQEAIEKGKTRLGPLYKVAAAHDKLSLAIEEIRRSERTLYSKQADIEGRAILQKAKELRSGLPELDRGPQNNVSQGLELGLEMDFDLFKARMERLQRDFDAIPVPGVANPRFWDYQRLVPLVDRCAALFKGLEEKRNAGLSIRTRSGLKDLQEKLDGIPRDLSRAYVSARKALADAREIATRQLKEVEGRPRWFYRLADLVA